MANYDVMYLYCVSQTQEGWCDLHTDPTTLPLPQQPALHLVHTAIVHNFILSSVIIYVLFSYIKNLLEKSTSHLEMLDRFFFFFFLRFM